jgi:hypothetical protein
MTGGRPHRRKKTQVAKLRRSGTAAMQEGANVHRTNGPEYIRPAGSVRIRDDFNPNTHRGSGSLQIGSGLQYFGFTQGAQGLQTFSGLQYSGLTQFFFHAQTGSGWQ